MNLLLWTTFVCYSITIIVILQRVVAIRQGKVALRPASFSRTYRYLEKVTDVLAYNMVIFVQEFIWHSYIYLVKLVRSVLRLSRKWLHRVEKWFTRAAKKADKRNRDLDL